MKLGKVYRVLCWLINLIPTIILCSLTGINFVQIILRDFLGSRIDWCMDFSIISFVWLVFIGAAYTSAKNDHIKVSFLIERLPFIMRKILNLMALVLVIIFLVVVLYSGWLFIFTLHASWIPTIKIRQSYIFLVVWVSLLFMLIHRFISMYNVIIEILYYRRGNK